MVGLSQIDELKVECKCAGEQDPVFRRQLVDHRQCTGGVAVCFFAVTVCFGVPAPDRSLAKRLHFGKEFVSGLLAQNLAQQHAERAHIAPQGRFFQVTGLRFQFCQPLRPALGIPQKGHRLLIMHDRM